MTADRAKWIAIAACGEADPRLFDTGCRSPKTAAKRAAEALEYCASCPVAELCLSDQVEFEANNCDEPQGVFGGTMPDDRKHLVLRRRQEILANGKQGVAA